MINTENKEKMRLPKDIIAGFAELKRLAEGGDLTYKEKLKMGGTQVAITIKEIKDSDFDLNSFMIGLIEFASSSPNHPACRDFVSSAAQFSKENNRSIGYPNGKAITPDEKLVGSLLNFVSHIERDPFYEGRNHVESSRLGIEDTAFIFSREKLDLYAAAIPIPERTTKRIVGS